jgi:predicted Zn-dependent protease
VWRNRASHIYEKTEGEPPTLDKLQKSVNIALRLGGEFADARFENTKTRQISMVNGSIRTFNSSSRSGVALRVKSGGSWGLASTTSIDLESLKTAAKKAFELAKKSSGYSDRKIVLPEVKSRKEMVKAKVRINHEDVDTREKLGFVKALDSAQAKTDRRIVNKTSSYAEIARNCGLVNSFGSELQWNEIRTVFLVMSVASEAGKLETSMDRKYGTVGYELVKETDPNEF